MQLHAMTSNLACALQLTYRCGMVRSRPRCGARTRSACQRRSGCAGPADAGAEGARTARQRSPSSRKGSRVRAESFRLAQSRGRSSSTPTPPAPWPDWLGDMAAHMVTAADGRRDPRPGKAKLLSD